MKITKIPFDDILFDAKMAAEIIVNICKRSKSHVSGLCELSESVAIIFSNGMEKSKSFVFAKFEEKNDDGKIAEIHDRYRGGFDLVGTFFIDDQLWGLFKKME